MRLLVLISLFLFRGVQGQRNTESKSVEYFTVDDLNSDSFSSNFSPSSLTLMSKTKSLSLQPDVAPCQLSQSAVLGTLTDTVTVASGSISLDGSYENDAYCVWSISKSLTATPNTQIVLSFSSFWLECGYDFLTIYDGPDNQSPVLAQLCGPMQPSETIFYASGSSLTVEFTSDNSVATTGFVGSAKLISACANANSQICSNKGQCINNQTCQCNSGYRGSVCQYEAAVNGPPPRYHLASAYDDNSAKWFLFGGSSQAAARSLENDMYVYSTITYGWSHYTSSNGNTWPSARLGHKIAVNGQFVYMFGGQSEGHWYGLNDFWRYDIGSNSWTQLPDAPVPMMHHSLIAVNNVLYAFGGIGSISTMLKYDIDSNAWTALFALQNEAYGISGVYHSSTNSIYYFGVLPRYDNDGTWKVMRFDLTVNTVLFVGTGIPCSMYRIFATAHIHPTNPDVAILVGGITIDMSSFFDESTNTCFDGNVLYFSLDCMQLYTANRDSAYNSRRRMGHASLALPNGTLLVFGGTNGVVLNDLVVWPSLSNIQVSPLQRDNCRVINWCQEVQCETCNSLPYCSWCSSGSCVYDTVKQPLASSSIATQCNSIQQQCGSQERLMLSTTTVEVLKVSQMQEYVVGVYDNSKEIQIYFEFMSMANTHLRVQMLSTSYSDYVATLSQSTRIIIPADDARRFNGDYSFIVTNTGQNDVSLALTVALSDPGAASSNSSGATDTSTYIGMGVAATALFTVLFLSIRRIQYQQEMMRIRERRREEQIIVDPVTGHARTEPPTLYSLKLGNKKEPSHVQIRASSVLSESPATKNITSDNIELQEFVTSGPLHVPLSVQPIRPVLPNHNPDFSQPVQHVLVSRLVLLPDSDEAIKLGAMPQLMIAVTIAKETRSVDVLTQQSETSIQSRRSNTSILSQRGRPRSLSNRLRELIHQAR